MFDQVFQDVKTNALDRWDYSPAYPSGFAGTPGPVVVEGFHWQHDDQIMAIMNLGQDTRAVVDIMVGASRDGLTRTFGDIYGQNMSNQASGTTLRLGKRYRVPLIIGCWVDQQMGGLSFARKLASQVMGAMFYYRNRLTTIRHIDFLHNRESFPDQAQLYTVDLLYEGDVFVTIDV